MTLLSGSLLRSLLHEWGFWARKEQLPPGGAWRCWVFMGGRGAGKTRAGAEWIASAARSGRASRIALVGPTFHDVREVMIEGNSGIRRLHGAQPTFEASRKRLSWPNGAQAFAFSAEDPESLRGPQFDAAWCDELCFWAYPDETLTTLEHALRLGQRPQMLVTTTPRPASPSQRAIALQPAAMGELVWALWPGPIDRWDDANVVRVKLYNGALASVSAEQVLNGANVFAIEAEGEWEVIQARNCVLAGPGEYDLSGFLRGRLGSGHAMRSPHPLGARIVVLDQRLVRAAIGAHEWGEALSFAAPPHGRASTDPRAATTTATLPHASLRPWAPAHVKGKRDGGGNVALNWVRCARLDGDSWGEGEPPLGEPGEAYRLEIMSGTSVVRSVDTVAPDYLYAAADQTADFGTPPAFLTVRVMQLRTTGAAGLKTELTIPL